MILQRINENIATQEKLLTMESKIKGIAQVLINADTIYLAGNGGSAADCQHIATELMGRFQLERKGIKGISLTTDTSLLTAISNDYSFNYIFARQIEALGTKEDVLIVISTSGNSENLINAVEKAKEKGIKTVGLLGKSGGKLKKMCDYSIVIPSESTPRIQESHILISHILCELIENDSVH